MGGKVKVFCFPPWKWRERGGRGVEGVFSTCAPENCVDIPDVSEE